MYRPEGLYDTLTKSPFANELRESPAMVEFALDAMLEGFIHSNYRVKVSAFDQFKTPIPAVDGYLVFIPKEG
ncbi:hypothetical protein LCGC14_3111800 [marine sediment metagenome]|uniref:Uncharacterized protein n=1 Tax=marine sediment metagenome TaxID=412755 RepID=A0A0F8WTR8_9ZZZZ